MRQILTEDEKYMKEAIRQAKKAWKIEEVPIGCVIVYQGKIIGRGYNRRTTDKNPLAHAEISAIKKASKVMGDWRLEECTLYVKLEHVHYTRTLSDVCRCHCTGKDSTSGCWMYESESRMRRFHPESSTGGSV